jgi:hypothetical protein
MENTTRFIQLRIILQKPVDGVVYGLQEGKGNEYKIIQSQKANGADLVFELSIIAKLDKTGAYKLSGPFVQGKPGEHFIYVGIGTYAGQMNTPWSRRLKIPLFGITNSLLDKLDDKTFFITTVPGTGKDGGPNCATVKPFAGWKIN